MTDLAALFSPFGLGTLTLPNRIVMAPMTRLRAPGSIPATAVADYYAQRATAGLIISESIMISDTSAAYMNAPGLFADEHIDPWRRVTDAVHMRGGRIFAQLWHSGRVGHSSLQPDGKPPLAPSAIAGEGTIHTVSGRQPLSVPRALSLAEVAGVTRAFGKAAARARAAGFDGLELHGAYGYLIDQFLQDRSNRRTDEYGGSLENRLRFLLGVVTACQQEYGRDVGVKLSPANRTYGMGDSDPVGTFSYIANKLDELDLAYLHFMEPFPEDIAVGCKISSVTPMARRWCRGPIIANGGFDMERAVTTIAAGQADLVSFGRSFIANPDLVDRFLAGIPCADADPATVYWIPEAPLERGYTDYLPHK
ncbi:alkene reductase [Sphingobium lactosutens]|uniref:alkene reductase n=1 Tax=Sphingobium lactosutens TaxID=522773 RepID=UPI0015C121F8|nr:alkene reductase [Sphingobium lactosutens]NWK97459.1 alkene reductase [Sphingobium lactosutens]